MLKAIIFDVDGVIAETESIHMKAFKKTFERFNINFTPEFIRELIGPSARDNIIKINNDFNINVDVEEYIKKRNDKYLELLDNEPIIPNPGLKEILLWGKKNNIKQGICSSSIKPMVDKVLNSVFKSIAISESAYDFFNGITTGDEVKRKKPFPDIYLNIISKLNLKPSECMAIEDSVTGIESAKSAGCKTVGLITPFYNRDDLINADKVAVSLEEIIEKKFWGWFNSKPNKICGLQF